MRITALILLASLPLLATEKWSVGDVLFQERASEMELSRDGSKLVWVKAQMSREKGIAVSNIYLRYLNDGHDVTLTRGTDGATSPAFSPTDRG